MSSAKGGKKIIESDLVGQVDHLNRGDELLLAFGVEHIFSADTDVEQVAWLDAIRVMVVVF